jgi:deoxyhypusine synthase
MRQRLKPLETAALKTVELSGRPSKVSIGQFSTAFSTQGSVSEFLRALPDILAGKDIRALGGLVAAAKRTGKEILLMFGGHVVKTGLTPLIVRMMRERLVTAIAVNGAVAVHDAEIAMVGATSEEVAPALSSGMFGTARETAELLNAAAEWARRERKGLGEGMGHALHEAHVPHGKHSLLFQAYDLEIPVTVHVALGTDVVHQHPSASGEAIGAASLLDFRLLAAVVAKLEEGVVINIGSAVVLPEVFVKALNLARNLGHRVERFTAADFDFVLQYRP